VTPGMARQGSPGPVSRPADSCIGAPALPEHVVTLLMPRACTIGPLTIISGVEIWVEHCTPRVLQRSSSSASTASDHHGQVCGLAARHDRVNGDFLDRCTVLLWPECGPINSSDWRVVRSAYVARSAASVGPRASRLSSPIRTGALSHRSSRQDLWVNSFGHHRRPHPPSPHLSYRPVNRGWRFSANARVPHGHPRWRAPGAKGSVERSASSSGVSRPRQASSLVTRTANGPLAQILSANCRAVGISSVGAPRD